MDTSELEQLAKRARFMRESGIALLIASCILGVFLFIPLHGKDKKVAEAPVATSTAPNAFANVPMHAQAAIVYDLAEGKVLFAKNEEAQLPLASLTKLLTVYSALSGLPPAMEVTITADEARQEAPRAFVAGDRLSLSDLARLTLTASLNDGAMAIADTAAASRQQTTAQLMASVSAALGLTQTYATNGSGLDESLTISGGYGSAKDVALLAGALVEKAPEVALATTKPTATATSLNGKQFTVKNTNPTVENIPRLLLSKTGFTDLAGGNLAIVFDAGIDHPVAIVVLGSDQKARFTDTQALIAATLAHFSGVASL